MSTGERYVAITSKRLLGLADFKDRLLDYLKAGITGMTARIYGQGGVFGSTPIALVAGGTDRFSLDPFSGGWSPYVTDGLGHIMRSSNAAENGVTIHFENTNAIPYYVGLHYTERPRDVQINTGTTKPEFIAWEECIGERAEPTALVNNGNGTLTFTVTSVAEASVTHASRKCLVWKKVPGTLGTTEALAVEECTVAYTGGLNKITTATLLGQPSTNVSTTAADYYVLMLGPTVRRNTDLRAASGYAFIGIVTGAGAGVAPSVFNIADQRSISTTLAVDLNQVTRVDAHGDMKIRVGADASDSNEPQIEVMNAAAASRWKVDENGDMTVQGESNLNGVVSINTASNIGNLDADVHIVKGDWGHYSIALADYVWRMTGSGLAEFYRQIRLGQTLAAGAAANALIPRLRFRTNRNASATYTHFIENDGLNADGTSSGQPGVRWYVHKDGRVIRVTNASWDGTNWTKDIVGTAAHKETFSAGNWKIETRLAGTGGTWNDVSWEATGLDFNLGSGVLSVPGGMIITSGGAAIDGAVTLGGNLLGDATAASNTRLRVQFRGAAATGYTYVCEMSPNNSTGGGAHLYVRHATKKFMVAWGATWDGTQWARDTGATVCRFLEIDADAASAWLNSPGATFADSAVWTTAMASGADPIKKYRVDGTIEAGAGLANNPYETARVPRFKANVNTGGGAARSWALDVTALRVFGLPLTGQGTGAARGRGGEFHINCTWDENAALFSRLNAGEDAYKIDMTREGVVVWYHSGSASATWADTDSSTTWVKVVEFSGTVETRYQILTAMTAIARDSGGGTALPEMSLTDPTALNGRIALASGVTWGVFLPFHKIPNGAVITEANVTVENPASAGELRAAVVKRSPITASASLSMKGAAGNEYDVLDEDVGQVTLPLTINSPLANRTIDTEAYEVGIWLGKTNGDTTAYFWGGRIGYTMMKGATFR